MIPYFDGACTGRYSTSVIEAVGAYREFERASATHELHRFHTSGYEADLHGLGRTPQPALSVWPGFTGLERRLVRAIPHAQDHWLVEYGTPTFALLNLILKAVQGTNALVCDDLYRPWRSMLAAVAAAKKMTIRAIQVREGVRADNPDSVVTQVIRQTTEYKPSALFLSLVTQDGVRMPIETITSYLWQSWPSQDRDSLPLVVIDGCQGFGRVPFDLPDVREESVPVAFIGCLHKALRGPKEMAFLLCSHPRWRRRIGAAREELSGCPSLYDYARTAGRDHRLPTLDCARAIGAAAALEDVTAAKIESRFVGVSLNQIEFEAELQGSGWRIVSPSHPTWLSGIVLLEPPPPFKAARSRHGIKELLAPVAVDELGGFVRVAFDPSHALGTGGQLARFLRQVTAKLN